jgi:hypothetical protein
MRYFIRAAHILGMEKTVPMGLRLDGLEVTDLTTQLAVRCFLS